MLLPSGREGHWCGRRGTSIPHGISSRPASSTVRCSASGRMESHGRDPAPHASSLFVLIRSEVPYLSTVLCFFSCPSSWPLESYWHPPSASTELVLTLWLWISSRAFLPAIPGTEWGPRARDKDQNAQLSPYSNHSTAPVERSPSDYFGAKNQNLFVHNSVTFLLSHTTQKMEEKKQILGLWHILKWFLKLG